VGVPLTVPVLLKTKTVNNRGGGVPAYFLLTMTANLKSDPSGFVGPITAVGLHSVTVNREQQCKSAVRGYHRNTTNWNLFNYLSINMLVWIARL